MSRLSSASGKYYIATMTMITASTSLTIFIMNIHFCGAEAKPVPHWAKVLIIDYMSKIFFVYEVGESCTTPESESIPLYSEGAVCNNLHDSSHDLYLHRSDAYKYSNGHGIHQQANGGANHNHYSSRLERIDLKQDHARSYRHIGRNALNLQAPPPSQNLQHLDGGLKEKLLYPAEKVAVQACTDCCPCVQHKQVQQPSLLFLHLLASTSPPGIPQVHSLISRFLPQVVRNIQFIANCFREQKATSVKVAEWKKVAKVMDRFFMWIFFVMVFLMSILIIAKAS